MLIPWPLSPSRHQTWLKRKAKKISVFNHKINVSREWLPPVLVFALMDRTKAFCAKLLPSTGKRISEGGRD